MNTISEMIAELEGTFDWKLANLKLDIAETVFNALESSGMSKSELSRRTGMSRYRINQLLAGDMDITLRRLLKIAEALRCDMTAPALTPTDGRAGE